MSTLSVEHSGSQALALATAAHHRGPPAAGFTVAGGIDVLIAAFCIEHGHPRCCTAMPTSTRSSGGAAAGLASLTNDQ